MNSRLLKSALIAACALAPLAIAPAGPAMAQTVISPSQEIVLSIGRGELITVPGSLSDIFIADADIADVEVKSQRQLYIFGKSGGETTLYASNARGDIVWSANIRVGSNIDSIPQMLALAMPEADIQVATMGSNMILLTGTVAAPEDASEAERLVKAFVGDGANVVSRLRMSTPMQVNLRVRFAEVSRSLIRTIGANLATFDGTGGFKFSLGQGRSFLPSWTVGGPLASGTGASAGVNVIRPNESGVTLGGIFGDFLGLDIASALDLAEMQGLSSTLSEPNLTALSGETAEFLAGGEFPIPMSQGLGATSVTYKNYGVSLSYTPTVLANGRISLRVRPEVSELSSMGAVIVDNFSIPALITRRADTTVELGSGQSFMIAGLLTNNANSTIDKAPGVGDIPILGNLFKSTDFRKGQTELVIIVTPYLVEPVNDSEIVLPTDGFQAPTTAEQFFGNKESSGFNGVRRPMPRAAGEPETPGISALEHSGPALADKSGETGQGEQFAEAPAPGFSLK